MPICRGNVCCRRDAFRDEREKVSHLAVDLAHVLVELAGHHPHTLLSPPGATSTSAEISPNVRETFTCHCLRKTTPMSPHINTRSTAHLGRRPVEDTTAAARLRHAGAVLV